MKRRICASVRFLVMLRDLDFKSASVYTVVMMVGSWMLCRVVADGT